MLLPFLGVSLATQSKRLAIDQTGIRAWCDPAPGIEPAQTECPRAPIIRRRPRELARICTAGVAELGPSRSRLLIGLQLIKKALPQPPGARLLSSWRLSTHQTSHDVELNGILIFRREADELNGYAQRSLFTTMRARTLKEARTSVIL